MHGERCKQVALSRLNELLSGIGRVTTRIDCAR